MTEKQKINPTLKISIYIIVAFIAGIYAGKLERIPFFAKGEYSIGIYTGESPFQLESPENIKNPVLTAKDV